MPDPRNYWPPEKKTTLSKLWARGISTADIGKIMEYSKNAVIGQAHRMGLPKRPSPVRKKPDLVSPVVWTLHNIGPGQCRFPEGEPGTEGFHLCGEPVIEGKPYCFSHFQRAHMKPGQVGAVFRLPNLTTLDK